MFAHRLCLKCRGESAEDAFGQARSWPVPKTQTLASLQTADSSWLPEEFQTVPKSDVYLSDVHSCSPDLESFASISSSCRLASSTRSRRLLFRAFGTSPASRASILSWRALSIVRKLSMLCSLSMPQLYISARDSARLKCADRVSYARWRALSPQTLNPRPLRSTSLRFQSVL